MTSLLVSAPGVPIDAVVRVPGSKSVANRALMCAALARSGLSRLSGVPVGDDCVAMLEALREAGCLAGDGSIVGGVFPGQATSFSAGLAGTTSRFLTAAGALSVTGVVIDGGEPLRARPMGDLHAALSELGATVESVDGRVGHLPVKVSRGGLTGGAVSVRGDVSSQFVSALMLIGPRLEGGLEISVTGDLVSRPYVEMTASVMRAFGADVSVGSSSIKVSGEYVATDYVVEPDFSSAAFPVMSLAFAPGRIRLPGLALASMQGDARVLDIARAMGLGVSRDGDDIVVTRATGDRMSPVELDLRDESDLVPAVAVACTVLPGTSTITGVGFIRAKESDRIGDLARELNSAGADVTVLDDGLRISGGAAPSVDKAFGTHHDHRLAMAFSLVAVGGGRCVIDDPDVVAKSWPGYFDDMRGVLGPTETLN